MPTPEQLAQIQKALSSLVDQSKIAKYGDVYSYIGSLSPLDKPKPSQQPKPPRPPKPEDPDAPKLPEYVPTNTKLDNTLIDIIVEDGNLINLGIFLRYTKEETHDIIYNKSTYTIKNLPSGVIAQVDTHNNLQLNEKDFNYLLKYNSSLEKPETYWFNIYAIAHEVCHALTRSTEKNPLAEALDEAIVPFIEFEFYTNYNGSRSPHIFDRAETMFERMMNKRAGSVRTSYPTETFYFFDQLISMNSLDHSAFIHALRDYAHAGPTFKAKKAAIDANFPYFPLQEK